MQLQAHRNDVLMIVFIIFEKQLPGLSRETAACVRRNPSGMFAKEDACNISGIAERKSMQDFLFCKVSGRNFVKTCWLFTLL